MAEPFLLRPWEIERLTDTQIRIMIEGQSRMIESSSGDKKADGVVTSEDDTEFASRETVEAILSNVQDAIARERSNSPG